MRRILLVLVLMTLAGCTIGLDPDDGTPDIETDDDPADVGGDETDNDTSGDETDDDAASSTEANGTLVVHAIDVGQADATLIEAPEGETMLIDSGDWREDGETVLAYLEEHDVDRIDYLVTTHPHADHIGGHAAVIETYETDRDGIGEVWDPGVAHTSNTYERYLDAIEEHDVTLIDAREGDEVPIGGVDAELYNPPADPDTDDLHYNSLTIGIDHGTATFLFTGDAEIDAETRMVEAHGDDLDADVYHAGHHGSNTSSTDAFLEAVAPQVTIVSADYDSQYGHPHEEVLERFGAHGIDAYWTGVHGTIVFESDGETITTSTVSDATADPLTLRDEPEADGTPTGTVQERSQYDAKTSPGSVAPRAVAGVAGPDHTPTAPTAGAAP